MTTYLFELGSHPLISQAEIESVVSGNVLYIQGSFLIIEVQEELDCVALVSQLGGTKKIAQMIDVPPVDFLDSMQGIGKIQFSLLGQMQRRKGLQ